MSQTKKISIAIFSYLLFSWANGANASVIDLNLNDFTPSSTNITVSSDGSSATFTEDTSHSPVELNTLYSVPTDSVYLNFEYVLDVAASNKDYFDFYLDNISMPLFSDGGAPNNYSGSLSFDISSFAGTDTPILFSFLSDFGDGGFDSILTISNVNVTTKPIPAPATVLLMLSGILSIWGIRKKKNT